MGFWKRKGRSCGLSVIIRTISHNTFLYHNISWNNQYHFSHRQVKVDFSVKVIFLFINSLSTNCFQIGKCFHKQINSFLITHSEQLTSWHQKLIIVTLLSIEHYYLYYDFCIIIIIFYITLISTFHDFACWRHYFYQPICWTFCFFSKKWRIEGRVFCRSWLSWPICGILLSPFVFKSFFDDLNISLTVADSNKLWINSYHCRQKLWQANQQL